MANGYDLHYGEIRIVDVAAHVPEVVMVGIGLRADDDGPWIELGNHDGQHCDQLTPDEADRLADELKALAAIIRAHTGSEAR